MNILVVSSTQWHPQEDWTLVGARNLIEEALGPNINWVLYDRDKKRPKDALAYPNNFSHHTLAPFSMVVLIGSEHWHHPSLDGLYKLLKKSKTPVLALGLSLPTSEAKLSKYALSILGRRSSMVTARDIDTKNALRTYGIESVMLPCPSLFSSPLMHALHSPQNRKVAFLIDTWNGRNQRNDSRFLQSAVNLMENTSDNFVIEVACPTVNEFMRFSQRFGSQAFYSYDSHDYIDLIARNQILVTNNLTAAKVANSVGRVAFLIGEETRKISSFQPFPFILPAKLRALEHRFEEILSKTLLSGGIFSWKAKMKNQWLITLPRKTGTIREAA